MPPPPPLHPPLMAPTECHDGASGTPASATSANGASGPVPEESPRESSVPDFADGLSSRAASAESASAGFGLEKASSMRHGRRGSGRAEELGGRGVHHIRAPSADYATGGKAPSFVAGPGFTSGTSFANYSMTGGARAAIGAPLAMLPDIPLDRTIGSLSVARQNLREETPLFLQGSVLKCKGIYAAVTAAKKGRLDGAVLPTPDFFKYPEAIPILEKGGALMSFHVGPGHKLPDGERAIVSAIINLSAFADEVDENKVPNVRMDVREDAKQYGMIITKNCYLVPGLKLSHMTPRVLSSYDFQKNCQTSNVHVWDDAKEECTFRITKTVIRFIFSVTIQFRTSAIDPSHCRLFSELLGIRVDGGLLMERTKRNPNAPPDSTAKAKSVLLYSEVEGGLLVTNMTAVLNSAMPAVIANLMNNFGAQGLAEVSETAANTRVYLRDRFGLRNDA